MKMWYKMHCFLQFIFILLAVIVYQETTAAVLNNEALTTIVQKLEEKVNADEVEKHKFEATIANLEHELESVKNKSETNEKLIVEGINETKDVLITVERLDKMSRVGTSCSSIANLGNLESGTYLLDTDRDGNEAPFEAYCKMPERTTIVGNDTTFDFVHCNETFCSEKLISYEAPEAQIKLLVEKSPKCSQTITFECQSAPIMTIENAILTSQLQWRDRNGRYHNFTGAGRLNCNNMWPQMKSDVFELNQDSPLLSAPASTLLPVSAVRYGPLKFEWQKAKITVSKLRCDPYEEEGLEDRIVKIENAYSNLNRIDNNSINEIDRKVRNIIKQIKAHHRYRNDYLESETLKYID